MGKDFLSVDALWAAKLRENKFHLLRVFFAYPLLLGVETEIQEIDDIDAGENKSQNSQRKVSFFWLFWEEFPHFVIRVWCYEFGKRFPTGKHFATVKSFPTGKQFPYGKCFLTGKRLQMDNTSHLRKFWKRETLPLCKTLPFCVS